MPFNRYLVSCVVVILANSLLLFSQSARLPAVSANETYAWQQVDSLTTQDLFDVDMLSNDDGWAVGGNSFLHWDGNSWLEANSTTQGFFQGVSMVSSSDGWAVSWYGTIARWDGVSWKDFTTLPDGEWLWGVDMLAADDGWIVGDEGTILRWNGTKWSFVPSPVDFRLAKVHMVSADEGWIVGYDFDSSAGVILRWDGTEWTKQTIPTKVRLFDIAMTSPTEAWAVGENGVVLHWENGVWDEWKNPTLSKDGQNQVLWLMGIDMLSPSSGWFVGGYIGSSFTARWDGTSWKSEESNFGEFLQAVDMVAENDGWAVGYGGTILHYTLLESPPATPTSTATATPTSTPTETATPTVVSTPDPDQWFVFLPTVFGD